MGFLVLAVQKMEREPNNERGGGEGRKQRFLYFFPTPFSLLLTLFFMQSLTLVPCSLLQNCKETLATQASTLMKLHTAVVVLILWIWSYFGLENWTYSSAVSISDIKTLIKHLKEMKIYFLYSL